ncbi:YqiA/YcfP family alpha/beta fold hydrolase [Thauera sp.]|uniref:YqiA/YcfP family alpha/beta fold hydrolase n=1 Tax=Thauera sp. TaxID=1905334 RepID=UPI002BBF04BB|nr:YqiA/YcfP family alpha/beta fold hydrolase [Thauera sp.]HRP23733.1 YqiA/YcfP family alpha/beta fold hydrolase [Thauera sp.]
MIIYLHGFRSAPASIKAQALRARMLERGLAERFWCEQLPVSPRAAIALAEAEIARARAAGLTPTLVGSSLGGYYATWLAERHALHAALVNPAVVAPLELGAYVGMQDNMYTGERFEFTREHIDELRAIEVPTIAHPERFWLLVETGDEVLDYRHAVAKYAGARQTVLEGGDHGFSRWNDYLDALIAFAGLGETPSLAGLGDPRPFSARGEDGAS